MDRLDAMQVFVTTVESGSFSAASRLLNTPLPTVSRKVAELEDHLNTRLLIRTTRKLSLTDAGQAYLVSCKRVLEEVSDMERTASGEYITPKGELIVAAPIVFGRLHVLPVVNEFLATFPEINVQMRLSDRVASIIDDHIDMAVRVGRLPDSNMMATRVGSVRRVVCASPQFLAAHGTPKSPHVLERLPCVSFSDQIVGARWMFNIKGKQVPVPIRARLTVNTGEAAIDAACEGVGFTQVLSYQVMRACSENKLKIVLPEFEVESMPVSVIHAAQGKLPLKMRRFLEFAVPRLRRSLGDSAS